MHSVVKLTDAFNGADMRNVCTEAGMYCSTLILVLISIDTYQFWMLVIC
jgi:hypothetical protein